MHPARGAHRLLALLTLWSCAAAGGIPEHGYRQRREALRKALPDGVIVLFGGTEREKGDLRGGFFQEPNFFYLTGWQEPGAILVIEPRGEALFIPQRNPVRDRYTGRKAAPDDADIRKVTGFDHIFAAEAFEGKLPGLIEPASRIYALLESPEALKLKALLPLRELSDAGPALARLRMVKSAKELELIQRAIDASIEAHRAAWRRLAPGLHEYQIAATLANTYLERGCERSAYPPIIASGPAAVVLHYTRNKRRIDRGELVVMDAGAECASYAADLTRTLPASGRFTGRQRELYEIVLGAQKAAIAAARPGMMLTGDGPNSLLKIAKDYMDGRGKAANGEPLSRCFSHGLGHHVGLEVHDAFDPALPLAPGTVITIEPGLYVAEENIGIRIEDMILITENGARVLSAALPKEIEDIERALARRN